MDKVTVSKLLKHLKEHKSDPETLLAQAEHAFVMATDGYESELPGKYGPQVVVTRNPAVAVQAVQMKLGIVKYLVEYVGKEEEEKQDLNLVIHVESITEVTP